MKELITPADRTGRRPGVTARAAALQRQRRVELAYDLALGRCRLAMS